MTVARVVVVVWWLLAERVRFLLVRGRTHLRLEQRRDARYWLALAREGLRATPDALSDTASRGLTAALADLEGTGPSTSVPLGGGTSSATPTATR